MFGIIVYDILFFGVPILLLVLFGASLYRYITARKRNEEEPGTFPEEEMKSRKTALVVTSILMGIVALVAVGFVALLFMAIAYM